MGKRGRPPQGSHRPLSRKRIVKAAMRIVDRDGLSALSMRRLGASLGVDPMAIYYYIPNKGALYDAIVEAVMEELTIPAGPVRAEPVERLKAVARAYRDALLAHPNALAVIAARPIRTRAAMQPIEKMIGIFMELGVPLKLAMAGVNTCAHYILGSVQSYIPHLTNSPIHQHGELVPEVFTAQEFPNLYKVFEISRSEHPFETEFEIGLDALLRGFLSAPSPPIAAPVSMRSP
ncbi:MAG: TetR/AcrR family transcriptional regulator C-terminal domain-containing protein [Spirochaetia bacterium]|jgi:AcrR family transcriptional regulator